MILGCGNNISKQINRDAPQVLCCPTQVSDVDEAEELHIAFSHILWKTKVGWKHTGFNSSSSYLCDTIQPNWKVAMSENQISSITESGSVVLCEGVGKWRTLHFQNFTPNSPRESPCQYTPNHKLTELCDDSSDKLSSVKDDDMKNSYKSEELKSTEPKGQNYVHTAYGHSLNSGVRKKQSVDSKETNNSVSGSLASSNDRISDKSVKAFRKLCIEDNALLAVTNDDTVYSGTIPVDICGCKVSEVALGKEHHVVLTKEGSVYTWGSGMRGQLGTGFLCYSDIPELVEGLQGLYIRSISCGGWHCLALSDSGDTYVWGWNESGQLGYPFKTEYKGSLCNSVEQCCQCPSAYGQSSSAESKKKSSHLEKELNTDDVHFKRRAADERINHERAKEILNVQASPKLLEFWTENINISEVACGDQHTLFLLDDATVWTAGMNKYGQLGLGHMKPVEEPSEVPLKNVKKIYAGGWNSLFVT